MIQATLHMLEIVGDIPAGTELWAFVRCAATLLQVLSHVALALFPQTENLW